MKFRIITIFPDFFKNSINFSLLKKAQEKKLLEIEIIDLRDFADQTKIHKMIDDRPYGGGAGMVMMVGPLYKALKAIKNSSNIDPKLTKTIIFTPKGRVYDQKVAENFSTDLKELILIAPHYEGFDERILNWVDAEICVGDFVLTGGEIPALLVIDSVSRLIPGVLGNEVSNQTESFSELKNGERNLEHAQYTRPEVFKDDEGIEYRVPEVLLSGNHKNIENWKNENSKSD